MKQNLEEEYSEENRALESLKLSLENVEEKLMEATEEKLLWEERMRTAKKAKKEYLKEKGNQGEMEAMKREINRMNVRLSNGRKILYFKIASYSIIYKLIAYKI